MTLPSLRYTVDDLELMPVVEGERYEIIDGQIHVSRQPHVEHQYVTRHVTRAFDAWDPQEEHGFLVPAPGVIFARDDAAAPDLVWIARQRYSVVVGEDGKLHSAPDLAVEILSPGRDNERRDRELKVKMYSRHGVREYWIVDYRQPSVRVYRHAEGALALAATLVAGDAVTSPLLPGFEPRVEELCRLPR